MTRSASPWARHGVLVRSLGVYALLGLAACPGTQRHGDDESVLARVGDQRIYLEEFEAELARIKLDDAEGLPSTAALTAQRRALLDDMIARELILFEAEKANVVVGMNEVENLFQRMRHGWKDEETSVDCVGCVFEDELLRTSTTPTELKRGLREYLMIRKYFRDHVFSRVAVTDAEIEDYIAAHPESQLRPERVRALQIIVKTEEEADKVSRAIRYGMSFEEAAIKHSLSPEGKTGGDLGYFSRGSMPEVFDEVCFNLNPGSVSKVVASDYGFHLFKVVDKQPAMERPVDEVRQEVEQLLQREKERAAQSERLASLKKNTSIEIKEKVLAQLN